jgi:hypothetical protein
MSKKTSYVTHIEFQSAFTDLTKLISDQGETQRDNMIGLRKEMRQDMSSGKLDGRGIVALAALFIVVTGMGAGLSSFVLSSSLNPVKMDVDNIVRKMEVDDLRELSDAYKLGAFEARLENAEWRGAVPNREESYGGRNSAFERRRTPSQ